MEAPRIRFAITITITALVFLGISSAYRTSPSDSRFKCRLYSEREKDSNSRLWISQEERTFNLRQYLNNKNKITLMPCCYDGMTARLIEAAGFNLTFMTGFGVSASLGLPDAGLTTATDMVNAATTICNVLQRIPCIGDGDTGYGNPLNVKRTVQKYAQAGLSGIMIEDQLAPKRCGHTKGKIIVEREEAYRRIKAAVDARNEGRDIVILARTDARATHGLEEAIERCKMFRKLGADWTFMEAPLSESEMELYCREVDGPKLANMLEYGSTPMLPPMRLQEIGYTVAAYPLTLLSTATKAMKLALNQIKGGEMADILQFSELQSDVGFPEYYRDLDRYM